MIKNKFKFTLSQDLIDANGGNEEGIVFSAELVKNTYLVSWYSSDNRKTSIVYPIREVVEALEREQWVLVSDNIILTKFYREENEMDVFLNGNLLTTYYCASTSKVQTTQLLQKLGYKHFEAQTFDKREN